MSDFGFTHVALAVSDVDASISFYAKYARMTVVHRRDDKATQSEVGVDLAKLSSGARWSEKDSPV